MTFWTPLQATTAPATRAIAPQPPAPRSNVRPINSATTPRRFCIPCTSVGLNAGYCELFGGRSLFNECICQVNAHSTLALV